MQPPNDELTTTLAHLDLTSPTADSLAALQALKRQLISDGRDTTALFDEHLFEVFSALALHFLSEQDEVRNEAIACAEALAEQASPREMLLAVQEQIDALSQGQHASKGDDDGEEGDGDDAEAGPSTITGPAAARTALALLSLLSTALPRVKTKKASAFLRPLIRSMSRCVAATRGCTAAASDELRGAVVTLIEKAEEWAMKSSANEQSQQSAREDLAALLLANFAELGPRLSIAAAGGGGQTLAEEWFFDKRPEYRVRKGKAAARSGSDGGEELWRDLRGVVAKLDVQLLDIALGIKCLSATQVDDEDGDSNDPSPERAAVQLGAFMLFVMHQHRYSQDDGSPPLQSHTPEDALRDLHRSMPILTAALQGVAMSAPNFDDGDEDPTKSTAQASTPSFYLADCALLHLQWLLTAYHPTPSNTATSTSPQQQTKRPLPSDTLLLPLIQLLSTYAALCPSPPHRMISWTLLREEMKELIGSDEEDALVVDLLRDLVTESPFPQLRAAAVGLCRDLVSERLRLENGNGQALQAWRQLLTNSIFVLPPSPDREASASRIASYLSEHSSLFIEQLNVAYYLLVRGVRDEGARATLDHEALKNDLVEPLRRRLRAVKEEEVEQGEIIEAVLSQVEERLQGSGEAQRRP